MRTNHRWILTATLFAGLLARPALADKQLDTNAPAIIPPSTAAPAAPAMAAVPVATPAPEATPKPAKAAAKTAKKHTAVKKHAATKAKVVKKKAAVTEVSVPLKPGPATVSARHVNVRGKPTIYSEVLSHLTNGEPVTVIEEITRDNPKADDPTVWAKIVLPDTAHLWVSAQFVDTNKTVTVKKLNLRTGPGENYSVAGTLLKGATISDIGGTNGWIEVQSSTNAYAFVAAAYLKQEAAAPDTNAPAVVETTPATPTTVTDAGQIAPPATGTPNTTMPPASAIPITNAADTNSDVGTVEAAPTNAPAVTTPAVTAPVEPPAPRIVDREGIVRRTFSIQAPSSFELVNTETGRTINYLYTSSKQLDLGRYKGLHIIVTGEESLDERWKNTPVITVQKIQVLD